MRTWNLLVIATLACCKEPTPSVSSTQLTSASVTPGVAAEVVVVVEEPCATKAGPTETVAPASAPTPTSIPGLEASAESSEATIPSTGFVESRPATTAPITPPESFPETTFGSGTPENAHGFPETTFGSGTPENAHGFLETTFGSGGH
jgi:hypothetical protein